MNNHELQLSGFRISIGIFTMFKREYASDNICPNDAFWRYVFLMCKLIERYGIELITLCWKESGVNSRLWPRMHTSGLLRSSIGASSATGKQIISHSDKEQSHEPPRVGCIGFSCPYLLACNHREISRVPQCRECCNAWQTNGWQGGTEGGRRSLGNLKWYW